MVQVEGKTDQVEGSTHTVSASGAMLIVPHGIAEGTKVTIENPKTQAKVEARVVRPPQMSHEGSQVRSSSLRHRRIFGASSFRLTLTDDPERIVLPCERKELRIFADFMCSVFFVSSANSVLKIRDLFFASFSHSTKKKAAPTLIGAARCFSDFTWRLLDRHVDRRRNRRSCAG